MATPSRRRPLGLDGEESTLVCSSGESADRPRVEAAMSVKGRECRCGPESGNGQPTPTTALATLAIALPQLLELAAVLRLAGLLLDLLDKLLAPWASRKILDELAD